MQLVAWTPPETLCHQKASEYVTKKHRARKCDYCKTAICVGVRSDTKKNCYFCCKLCLREKIAFVIMVHHGDVLHQNMRA